MTSSIILSPSGWKRPDAIRLHGRVTDGAGDPVPDALIEVWQADASGVISREAGSLRRDGFTFTGWGRCSTDNTGHYSFSTVAPGATVAGTAALVRSLHTNGVAGYMAGAAINIDSKNPDYAGQLGHGRIDVLGAVKPD